MIHEPRTSRCTSWTWKWQKNQGTNSMIHWIIEKARNSRKIPTSTSLTTPKPLTVWITTNCGKFLKETGTPDYLTCLLRNLYAGQKATLRTGHRTMDWFQNGKGVLQDCTLSPCLFNLYAEYIMQNSGLDEAQAGIKIAERNINSLRYVDQFSSVQFSCSVMSDSLQPHELQHTRPPCPSPTPGVHSNSRPSSQRCHPAISSSVIPLSKALA